MEVNSVYPSNVASQLPINVMGNTHPEAPTLEAVSKNMSKNGFKKLKTTHNSCSIIKVYTSSRIKWREFKYQLEWKLGDFSPSLWWTCYVWIFKQKQPRITDAELVTSLTLQDEETFGSNAISCLIPARLSQESVEWLVGMVWERWERCCITHREKPVWSRVSTQICSWGWWFTLNRLMSISNCQSWQFFVSFAFLL